MRDSGPTCLSETPNNYCYHLTEEQSPEMDKQDANWLFRFISFHYENTTVDFIQPV